MRAYMLIIHVWRIRFNILVNCIPPGLLFPCLDLGLCLFFEKKSLLGRTKKSFIGL